MSPRVPTTPANRHAEKYRQRTERWTEQEAYQEFYRRIREATGLDAERAHEIAAARKHKLAVTLDGELKGPDFEHDRGDPFGREITRIVNMIDAEGRLPQPKTFEEIQAARKASGEYAI
ncbi:hypothetical protein BH24GEM1_BH24GEM1_31810 [soil metagenome]